MTATTWSGLRTLLVASPEINDSVSWWRAWGPLAAMRQDVDKLQLARFDFTSSMGKNAAEAWPLIEDSAVVFMNRPWQKPHLDFLDFARTCGRPTWLDYDDCLWEIPWANPATDFYGPYQLGVARDAATRASVISVSTPELAQYMQDRVAPDATIRLVPNALPDWYRWNSLARKKLVVYRGGRTHTQDLAPVAEDIVLAAQAHPDWHFVFCGARSNHGCVTSRLDPKQCTEMPMRPLPEFHAWLRSSGASLLIVPLADNTFNRCKSNIAWMEGTLAGAAVIAPAFEEFNVPGCMRYASTYQFRDMLMVMMQVDQKDRDERVKESRDWIDANRRLSRINGARFEIVRGLAGE